MKPIRLTIAKIVNGETQRHREQAVITFGAAQIRLRGEPQGLADNAKIVVISNGVVVELRVEVDP